MIRNTLSSALCPPPIVLCTLSSALCPPHFIFPTLSSPLWPSDRYVRRPNPLINTPLQRGDCLSCSRDSTASAVSLFTANTPKTAEAVEMRQGGRLITPLKRGVNERVS